MAVEWKGVLNPPVSAKWKEVLTPPCGSGMERGTYPTLWQWNGKRYLPHPVAVEWKEVYLTHPVAVEWKGVLNPSYVSKWKEVLTPPCGSGMERCT